MNSNLAEMKSLTIAALVGLIAISGQSAPKDKHKAEGQEKKDLDEIRGDLRISDSERRIINEYVADHHKAKGKKGKKLPPGLAKKAARGDRLPPGWEKKLVQGEVIPEEVFRETHPLPQEIVVKLPTPPPGTILVAIEGKVARIMEKTRKVLDVFDLLP